MHDLADEFVLFCHITSGLPDTKYPRLLLEKGGATFPHLAFLNARGNLVTVHRGAHTLADFQASGRAATRLLALRPRVEAGDAEAAIDLLLVELELGSVPLDEARRRISVLGPIPEDKRPTLQALLFDREVFERVRSHGSPQERRKVAQDFAGCYREGKVPRAREPRVAFYFAILPYAEELQDASLYEAVLTDLRATVHCSPAHQASLRRATRTLKELKTRAESAR